jgi:alpha-tubulin suppressor-like RCC1 family protein
MKDCNVVKVASMSTYSVVVDSEGGVYVWGTGGIHISVVSFLTPPHHRWLDWLHARTTN